MNGIYKFENLLNHKCYIGQSSNLEERYKKHLHNINDNTHQEIFYKALRKYGLENFSYEILESFNDYSLERLNILEQKYIIQYNSLIPNGYNMIPGGSNGAGIAKGIQIEQYTLSGEYIQTYESAKQASDLLNINHSNICSCCRGERNFAGGYQWKYVNSDKEIFNIIKIETPIYEDIIQQYDKQNNLIAEYFSLSEAHKNTNIHLGNISSCCKGKRKTAGGYFWKIKKEIKNYKITYLKEKKYYAENIE